MDILNRLTTATMAAVLMLGTLTVLGGDAADATDSTNGVAYVATGENFPDALGAGPAAAADAAPILLVRKTRSPAQPRPS